MNVVLMDFGSGTARLRSVAICFYAFYVSYPNESEGAVGFGYAKRAMMSAID